ncbi:WcaF family extracellular polysaccharide biosynthesis acetyltransferase, partial [Pseudomonadota bacterium]
MNDYRYQNLSSFSLPKGFSGKSILVLLLWAGVQKTFFSLSPQFLYGWRRFLLSLFGAKLGKGVVIRPSVRIIYPWKLTIGDYSWIGDDVTLYTIGEISIGSDTVISQKSYLCAGGHDFKSPAFDTYSKDITIGDKVWIATDVFV